MKIIKRTGKTVDFDKSKIEKAILKAMKYGSGVYSEELAKTISEEITDECKRATNLVGMTTVRNVEDMVYDKLIKYNHELTAKAY
ncbi:MAG: anaerobic ribonucleoside-triphosphate reductase, partial [Peptostreptococcaceae bacterium]|nr:anaerobic ribonucleoside-triphosphate reductase [Peptostreptococcaceae bacterium]